MMSANNYLLPKTILFYCLLAVLSIVPGKAQLCVGGTVTSDHGDTFYVCIDAVPDVVQFDSGFTAGNSYTYIITDKADTILGIPPGDMQDFNPAGPGECHVYGLAYDGTLNAGPGMHISNVSASGCSSLSINYLVAMRDTIEGGTVMTSGNDDTVYACIDGVADVFSFQNYSNTMPENYGYIITDDQEIIVGIPPGNTQDFDPAGPGECHVYGIAYLGDLNAMTGMNIANVIATECMELSSNYIVVLRDTIEGGMVTTSIGDDTVEVIIDGNADVITFQTSSHTMDMHYQYIITNDSDTILGLPTSNMQDFDPAGVGECHVYGVAYLGDLNAAPGMHISAVNATACYELSSQYLVVIRSLPNGIPGPETAGTIKAYPVPAAGNLKVEISTPTAGDGIMRLVDVAGKEWMRREVHLQQGTNTLTLTLPDALSGHYLLVIEDEYNVYNKQVILQ